MLTVNIKMMLSLLCTSCYPAIAGDHAVPLRAALPQRARSGRPCAEGLPPHHQEEGPQVQAGVALFVRALVYVSTCACVNVIPSVCALPTINAIVCLFIVRFAIFMPNG